jgi:hypothetical protein
VSVQNAAGSSGLQAGVTYQHNANSIDCAPSNPEAGFYEYVVNNVPTCHEFGQVGLDNNGYAVARDEQDCSTCYAVWHNGQFVEEKSLGFVQADYASAGDEMVTNTDLSTSTLEGAFGDPYYGTTYDHAWAVTFGAVCCNYNWDTVGDSDVFFSSSSNWVYEVPPSPFSIQWDYGG